MKTKNETELLNDLILAYQQKRGDEVELLKNDFNDLCESLSPLNLIKHVFREVVTSAEIKNNFTNNAVGLGTGFLLKKVLMGSTDSFGKKIIGLAIQFGAARIVSKNFSDIKLITRHFINQMLMTDKLK